MKTIGNQLLKNNNPFYPVGWNSVAGLYAPPNLVAIEHVAAYQQFMTGNTLAQMQAWGANTIRFQVCQNTLCNGASGASAAYITQLKGLASLAVASGFVVILCMQDEFYPPAGTRSKIKTEFGFIDYTNYGNVWTYSGSTTTAWINLGQAFSACTMVMFELYNECHWGFNNVLDPYISPQVIDPNWQYWNAGFQGLINTLRGLGVNNVVIAGGQKANLSFKNYPQTPAPASFTPFGEVPFSPNPIIIPIDYGFLNDASGSGVVYAVHPYNFSDKNFNTPNDYMADWGRLTTYVPVIATEWYNSSPSLVGNVSATFLDFCKSQNVGVLGWVFDDYKDPLPNTIQELLYITGVNLSDFTQQWMWNLTPMGVEFTSWIETGIAQLTHGNFNG